MFVVSWLIDEQGGISPQYQRNTNKISRLQDGGASERASEEGRLHARSPSYANMNTGERARSLALALPHASRIYRIEYKRMAASILTTTERVGEWVLHSVRAQQINRMQGRRWSAYGQYKCLNYQASS